MNDCMLSVFSMKSYYSSANLVNLLDVSTSYYIHFQKKIDKFWLLRNIGALPFFTINGCPTESIT